MTRSRAFTLIELLVVIAIIAILAAMLFPVYAQAKSAAKKATAIGHVKQLGTSAQLYLADYDDTFPTTYVPYDTARGYAWDRLVPAPDWFPNPTNAQRAIIQGFWANTVQPYMKSYAILEDPASVKVTGVVQAIFGNVVPPATLPSGISYVYNGLMHGYPASAVNSSSNLPVFWNGRGKAALVGWAYANPYMICRNGAAPCQYVPPSATCDSFSAGGNGQESGMSKNTRGTGYDVHNRGLIYGYADSSARWRRVGVYTSGLTDPRTDPFSHYEGGNESTLEWYDQYGCHAYLFRPDFDFSNWDPANAF